MNWKTRQLFSDREHGIVSGLSPISMTGGGNVPYPSYKTGGVAEYAPTAQSIPISAYDREEGGAFTTINPALFEGAEYAPTAQAIPISAYDREGGVDFLNLDQTEEPSIEQQVAELATKMGISPVEARAMILRQMIQAKGVTLSDEVINQFATGLITLHEALAQAMGPPKMQDGGIVPLDLFEEGDQDINEALNMMSGSVSPPLSDIGPTAPTETIEETVTVTEDQGPEPQSRAYEHSLRLLKNSFQEEIRNYVAEVPDSQKIKEYLKNVNIAYSNELKKLKTKHGVTSFSPDEDLFDPLFIEELSQIAPVPGEEIPSFRTGGGSVPPIESQTDLDKYGIPLKIEVWESLPPDVKQAWYMYYVMQGALGEGQTDTGQLNNLLAARMQLAGKIGESAKAGHRSYLPRILHQREANIAGQAAEAGALDKVLADQIASESAGIRAGRTLGSPTAKTQEALQGITEGLDTGPAFRNRVTSLGKDYPNALKRVILEYAELGAYPDPAYAVFEELYESETLGNMTWIEYFNYKKQMLESEGKLEGLTPGTRAYYAALMPVVDDWKKGIQAQKVKQ